MHFVYIYIYKKVNNGVKSDNIEKKLLTSVVFWLVNTSSNNNKTNHDM